jgi:hypothetical protein
MNELRERNQNNRIKCRADARQNAMGDADARKMVESV